MFIGLRRRGSEKSRNRSAAAVRPAAATGVSPLTLSKDFLKGVNEEGDLDDARHPFKTRDREYSGDLFQDNLRSMSSRSSIASAYGGNENMHLGWVT